MKTTTMRVIALGALVAAAIGVYVVPRPRDLADVAATPAAASATADAGVFSPIPNAQATYLRAESRMRGCFAAQQGRHAVHGGRALFVLNVGKDGRVEATKVEEHTAYDDQCLDCMRNVLRSLRFDPALDGEPVTIRIPVNLMLRGDEGSSPDGGRGG
jgi:hypothetical protein